MNKRIKKKAKQALLREQEIGKVIAYIFDVLVDFFKNLEVTIEETERQRTENTGRRTF